MWMSRVAEEANYSAGYSSKSGMHYVRVSGGDGCGPR
jgi:hypothetical protein